MLEKLRAWWRPKNPDIPINRRVKQYVSQTGFQYQYRLEKSIPGRYEFLIWTSAHAPKHVLILVPLPGVPPRDLYALAKLHLFRGFDECTPASLPAEVTVTGTALLDSLLRDVS